VNKTAISDVTADSAKTDARGRLNEAGRLVRAIVRYHPRYFFTAVAGAAVFAVCTVASSIGVRWMVDRVILVRFKEGRIDISALVVGSVLIVGIGLLRAIGVVVRRSFAGKTEWYTAQSITDDVIDHVVAQPVEWHRNRMTGDIVARCGVDADASVAILAPLPFSSSVLVMMIVSASWMLYVDLPLGLIAVGVFPILLSLNIAYQRRIDRYYNLAQGELGTLSEAVHESFDGVLVVKSFGAEQRETQRLAVITSRLRDARIKAVAIRSVFEAVMDAIPSLINIALIVLGSMRVRTGAMSVGDLTSFIYLFTLLVFPLRIIGYLFSEIPHSVAGWKRVREVLDEPLLQDPLSDIRVAPKPIAIFLDGVTFAHNSESNVLQNLSLSIDTGRTVAIVGATGSGKTTLLHLIAGLIPTNSGTIALQPGGVGLVFQEAFIFAETLRFNITLDASISNEQVTRALQISESSEFVDEIGAGLDMNMGERGLTLSGGQRQRIALARAIAQGRSILLLDDTTSALDPATEGKIVRNLRELSINDSSNLTVVIVASRPSTIALADEVFYLRDGVIVDHAPHDVLISRNAEYRELISAFEHDRHKNRDIEIS